MQNVVSAPLGFITGSVLDAFKERATRDYRERGEFQEIFVKLFKTLAIMSIVPTVTLIFFGPFLFGLVFGDAWREAGTLAQIMAIGFCLKFVASPLSYSYFVVGRTKEDFVIHVWIAVSSAIALWYGIRVVGDFKTALWAFNLNYASIYVLYLVRSYQFSRGTGGRPIAER